jgi:hypothetical protein
LREVEAPTFSDIWLIDGGKVVSPTSPIQWVPGVKWIRIIWISVDRNVIVKWKAMMRTARLK